jgi:hypothetical protein
MCGSAIAAVLVIALTETHATPVSELMDEPKPELARRSRCTKPLRM